VRVLEPRGEDAGYHYFVMELMDGGNLRDALRERRLTGSDAVERVLQVGDALAAAHAKGYVHRDVKPQNILLTAEDEAKLSDFDLVGAGDTTGGTRTGALGSFAFAAPECLSQAKDATPAADVYSLAMTMMFALTGEDPNPLTMDRSCARLQCGDATREVLRKAASIEAEDRHPNAEELVLGLREAMWNDASIILHEKTGIELVRSEGGAFLMGALEGEEGSIDDERPQHRVTLPPFWIGKHPVTNEQYARYLGENPKARKPGYWGDRRFDQATQPVVGVSWEEAARYAQWAGLRLPTEAEWEYACRAGTQGRYCSGESEADLDTVGWYRENSGRKLHVVGEKAPNGVGLYDMHGNVWEWCADWYGEYSGDEQRDPAGPASGQDRVMRGGSWNDYARGCRSAQRGWISPGLRRDDLGFRLAADQPR
jgi:formylglycine-generating enzyme required for sulfatase activity